MELFALLPKNKNECFVEDFIETALLNINLFLEQNRQAQTFDYLLTDFAKPQLEQALKRMQSLRDDGK